MPDLNFNVSLSGKIDLSDVEKMLKKCKVTIKVGYPSGRPHIDTIHIRQKDGSYKTASETGDEISELAKELYYGSSRTPARPFLTDAIEKNKDRIYGALKEEAKKVINGGQANWDMIGALAVGCIQEFVRGDYYKTNIPNSEEWQKIKGSDMPLIDGGDLINATTYIVEGK